GVLDLEVSQAGAGPDNIAQGVCHRAPQHVGDTGQGFEQGRDLGTTKFGHHESSSASRPPGVRLDAWLNCRNSRMVEVSALVVCNTTTSIFVTTMRKPHLSLGGASCL